MFVNTSQMEHNIPYPANHTERATSEGTYVEMPPFFMHVSEGGGSGSGAGSHPQFRTGTPSQGSVHTHSDRGYQQASDPSEVDQWERYHMRGPVGAQGQGERDTYQLQEAIDAKSRWVKLPDRKATVLKMAPPGERLPRRETAKVSATEKALQEARAGIQTLMKYQKHSKATFRPAIYNPRSGQALAPDEVHRADFIEENRRLQDIATQHVNQGTGCTYYPTKTIPKQGSPPERYTKSLEALQVTRQARALMQVQHVTQEGPREFPLQVLARAREPNPMDVHMPPKPPGGPPMSLGVPVQHPLGGPPDMRHHVDIGQHPSALNPPAEHHDMPQVGSAAGMQGWIPQASGGVSANPASGSTQHPTSEGWWNNW